MADLIERTRLAAKILRDISGQSAMAATVEEAAAALEAAREDAERLDWLAEGFRTCTVYMGGDHPWTPGHKVRSLHGPSFRAAIDQARGKENEND